MTSYRLGVDIGGTFTDLALYNPASSTMAIHKLLTTPEDPAAGVLTGIRELLAMNEIPVDRVDQLAHGTTLVTNAVIERKGGRTGLITTAGFRDVLNIGIENRYDQYDMRLRLPEPMVPRDLQMEVTERLRYDGSVVTPLEREEVLRIAEELVERRGAVAIAVCLLHSYANPVHEQQIKALLAETYPDVYVSVSAEVLPFMKEYDRWTTTTMNAFTQPMVDHYLNELERGLAELGFQGRFTIMTSNGGTVTTETARAFPVRLLESGPAAGALMTSRLGQELGLPNLLSYDMGGTTAKGALVLGGQPTKKYEMEVARAHEYKEGSGFTVKIPVIDMIEIGTGGGSIAHVDERGVLRVGPRSAGAAPGPACYGRGGELPTMTDADLVLGYLDPDFFLGGRMKLDKAAAEQAIMARLGSQLDLELTRVAWGIHETVNENVAQAFRLHASEHGRDYRQFAMVGFGGSGPVHALRIARILRIPQVILPVGAGVMSAFGLLMSPLSFETVRSSLVAVPQLNDNALSARFRPLIEEASSFLHRAGVAERDVTIRRRVDMRYKGQGYEIEVMLPDTEGRPTSILELPNLFAREYERIFSHSFVDGTLEITNFKVEAVGPAPSMEGGYSLGDAPAGAKALKGKRRAYFPEAGGYVDAPVYDRYALKPGERVEGPAMIEERESTCVVGVGDAVTLDENHHLIAEVSAGRSA